jgi:tripartite-type tricarboxylate transporter receptor subunit TctC
MPIQRLLKVLALGALCCATLAVAQTPTFPSRPLRILVPSVAGSSPDIRARQIAEKLAQVFGQPVLVENRPGANGVIAQREAAKSPPDGHTLFLALINNAVADALTPEPCCRLGSQLIPVSRFSMTPLLMVVNPAVPAQTLDQYVAYAKANPDKLSYASHGPGSVSQLVGEMLRAERGVKLLEVPYKGVNSELPDLIGGQLNTAFVVPQVVLASIRSGKLRALAVMGRERLEILPTVPSVAELGVPQLEAIAWNGIFVPAGTPPAIVQRLHSEIARILQSKEMRDDAVNLGSELGGERPDEFAAFVRAEIQKWGKVIKDAGIKIE